MVRRLNRIDWEPNECFKRQRLVPYLTNLSNFHPLEVTGRGSETQLQNIFFSIQRFNLLTAGSVHIRLLHFLLAHYMSAFKPVKDKK